MARIGLSRCWPARAPGKKECTMPPTAPLIVYGRANSVNVQAVMWTIAELGLPVIRHDVGHRNGGTDTPAYRAMNPMGKVPVLQDGDLTLLESAAIERY